MLAVYLFLPIVVLSTLAIWAAIRSTRAEATRLGRAVDDLNGLRPALIEVRSEAERTRRAFEQLRSR